MTKIPAVILLITAMTLSAQPNDRTKPPETPPLAAFKLPPVSESQLPNGLKVILVEDRRFPLVTVRLGADAGAKFDPADLPGLAEGTGKLLLEGTKSRSSRQIAEELAAIGGALTIDNSEDSIIIAGNALSENAGKLIELVADIAVNANFPTDEVNLYKQNRLQELLYQRSLPSTLADEAMAKAVFGSHPYSRTLPTAESVQKLSPENLASFRDSHLLPGNSVLILLGSLPPREGLLKMITDRFGGWQKKELPPAPPAKFPEPQKKIVLVDRPGSVQADIRVGKLAVDRKSPDHFPLLVGNSILGGGASSRLFNDIREKKGYAYDVHSLLDRRKTAGMFIMGAEVRNDVLEPALKDSLAHLTRMGKEPVTAAELTDVKNYLSGNFVLNLETQSGVAGQLMTTTLMDLPKDYLEMFTTRVRSVEPDQIQKAAQRYISPENSTIVVVGDGSKLKGTLEKFGPVTLEKASQ